MMKNTKKAVTTIAIDQDYIDLSMSMFASSHDHLGESVRYVLFYALGNIDAFVHHENSIGFKDCIFYVDLAAKRIRDLSRKAS